MTDAYRPTDSSRTERVQRIRPSQRAKRTESNVYAAPRRSDSSPPCAEAGFIAAAKSMPSVRMERVDTVREKIAHSDYDVDREFAVAIDRMISEEL
ncbi:MAG: flagellar biosynthesis anti-sigma factor FlgM [Planctomycetes bacterium]|nr:flagellar biosynthesis anti-sigma factor FlgM [Planctomycetota bacterium]